MTSSAAEMTPRAVDVTVDETELVVRLADGRRIATPISWFPRLHAATDSQRQRFELLGDGIGIHWPDIDEDLSVEGLLRGARPPAARDQP